MTRLPKTSKPGSDPLDTQELRDWRAILPRPTSLENCRLGNALASARIEGEEHAVRDLDWSNCPLHMLHQRGRWRGVYKNELKAWRMRRAREAGLDPVAYITAPFSDGRKKPRKCGKQSPSSQSESAAVDPE